jgi:dTDP-4-amino-4,6-dideoxygalactose transaminase
MTTWIPVVKPNIGQQEILAVNRILESGMLAQGTEVSAFENDFSKIVSDAFCVAVNSGTSAIHLSLLALGIGQGDEVIVPSFTFAATANAVALTGATPIFIDIDPKTYNLDSNLIEAAITSRTKAILPVHLYGQPAPMGEILDIAKKHDLLIIEDASQAHLANINGKPVGSFGAAGAFSFYPTKNMTSGEGGMVTTSSGDIARKIQLLRNQGMEEKYKNEIIGFNNRMTDINAAIGRVQLSKLDYWTEKRRSNASFLDQNLDGVVTPFVSPGSHHVYHQYTIRVVGHDRDVFAQQLTSRGIGSGVYYPIPVHRLPSYQQTLELPHTERATREVLSIPVYPSLEQWELESIVSAVNSISAAGS